MWCLSPQLEVQNSTHYRIIFTGNNWQRVQLMDGCLLWLIASHGRETLDFFVFHEKTLDEMSLGEPWGKLLYSQTEHFTSRSCNKSQHQLGNLKVVNVIFNLGTFIFALKLCHTIQVKMKKHNFLEFLNCHVYFDWTGLSRCCCGRCWYPPRRHNRNQTFNLLRLETLWRDQSY